MLAGELFSSFMAVALIGGAYSLFIRFFPAFFSGSALAGRRLPVRCLVYGLALFSVSLAMAAFMMLNLRAATGFGIGLIFMTFQLAGLAIGLLALGGLFGFLDPQAKPYSALMLGLALLWTARMFSVEISNWLCLLVGIYGVGAILVHYRGEDREPPAPSAAPKTVQPAAGQTSAAAVKPEAPPPAPAQALPAPAAEQKPAEPLK